MDLQNPEIEDHVDATSFARRPEKSFVTFLKQTSIESQEQTKALRERAQARYAMGTSFVIMRIGQYPLAVAA